MTARALMLQGTGSDVGKSLLTAGLARALTARGRQVRPFKPQNMSNNAAVAERTGLGGDPTRMGEIGRAQALQARACGVAPHVDMNPVLLKPQSDMGSQIVVQGTVFGQAKARDYYALKPTLLPKVLESFERMKSEADFVLVEGAGSPSEVNLRAGDIANMGFAEAADVPVVLVADIERGGVIASLVGAHALLTEAERARVIGYIINKFRGDVSLFDGALEIIADRTGMRSFGVVPWFDGARRLPQEDSVALDRRRDAAQSGDARPIRVAVPRLPRVANFDDLDPLMAERDVTVRFIERGEALPGDADLIILPGSKTTIPDLAEFKKQGWDIDLTAHIRRGGWVVGLCAGYQMLGRTLADPHGIEGPPESTAGLGWLNIDTVIGGEKTLTKAHGIDCATGAAIQGYEMHMGETAGTGLATPMLEISGRPDGAVAVSGPGAGRVMGCYLHGLFAADGFRAAFLERLKAGRAPGAHYDATLDATLDALAAHLERHLDIDGLIAAAR